jgi:glycosyltransferase involved in cell wall biosynthesis
MSIREENIKNQSEIPRILLVIDPNSVHAGRFVMNMSDYWKDIRVFSSRVHFNLDEHITDKTIYVDHNYHCRDLKNTFISKNVFFEKRGGITASRLIHFIDRLLNLLKLRDENALVRHLNKVIKEWKPDLVVALKLQNEGYILDQALVGIIKKPKIVTYLWGTDLEYFLKDTLMRRYHRKRIFSALDSSDLVIADTNRDINYLKELGYISLANRGIVATCGFTEEELNFRTQIPLENRNEIIIKCRAGDGIGHPEIILECIRQRPDFFKDYKLNFIMTSASLIPVINEICESNRIKFEIHNRLPYGKLLGVFQKSKYAIGASSIDGSPGFLIEAISMGCVPIYSEMESTKEWIKSGVNGLTFKSKISDLVMALEVARSIDLNSVVNYNQVLTGQFLTADTNCSEINNMVSKLLSLETNV